MKCDGFLCELYADTYSNGSGDCEPEIMESDSDVPTTHLLKKCQSCPLPFTSESETSTVRKRMQ
jgi:hypothetical protein